ncbi:MAG: hypothetical protein ABL953_05960 [Ilumatobacteraceae bacterium]
MVVDVELVVDDVVEVDVELGTVASVVCSVVVEQPAKTTLTTTRPIVSTRRALKVTTAAAS